MKKSSIKDALYWLLTKERFYGYLLSDMVVNYTDRVPVAGVNIKKGKINLYINRDAWAQNSLSSQVKILKHEIMHIIKGHIDRAVEKEKKFDNGANIAADCSINQLIGIDGSEKIKFVHTDPSSGEKVVNESEGITIETFREAIANSAKETGVHVDINKIEDKQSMDYYLELVREQQKNGKGPGYDSFDEHDIWQESDCTAEELKQIKKEAFKNALDKIDSKDAGQLPGELLKEIEDFVKVDYNWKSQLNKHVTTALDYLKVETRKKRNRRYGIRYPGYRKDPKINLMIGVDTSGSIGYNEAQIIFSHIKKIVDTYSEKVLVTVVECDYEIQRVYQLEKAPKNANIQGGGGTAYKPFFDYADKNKPDILLIFGDGYCFDERDLKKPKYPVIWAIDESGRYPVEWGKRVDIPLTNLKAR
jgi:predicted metal-dependent peptidase